MDKSAKTYCISTFGCQMNERDSERISFFMESFGFLASGEEDANIRIINTCTVRENANNKLFGHLGELGHEKSLNPNLKIILCGCMMQEDGVVDEIKKKYPFVDLIFGTANIEKFPVLLENLLAGEKSYDTESYENLSAINLYHKFPFKSGVNIMFGCNNFCSYCIVPYVRGREKSREPEVIIEEIRGLCADGVSEIMLLGQNVNSYGKGLSNPISFAELLEKICEIPEVKRLRFMTSHPKDLSDDLIDVIAKNPKICRHIHLPLQSGSSRLLKEMNRHYDKESYLALCNKIREKIPGIAITTDIIVGYPGEEDADIEDTIDVVKTVGFESAFTFIYSKRKGTPAAEIVDNTPEPVIKERFNRVLDVVRETSKERLLLDLGSVQNILVENVNEKEAGLMTGRSEKNYVVHFPGNADLIGKYVDVKLTKACGFYFIGELV